MLVLVDVRSTVHYARRCTQDYKASSRAASFAMESLETMSRYKSLKTICIAAVLSLGLAACGGGSNDQGMMDPPPPPPPPPPVAVDMSDVTAGYMAAAGTIEIAAGHSTTVGDVAFACAADGADCTVTVAADGSATATADSGTVTAANSLAYMARLDMDSQRMAVSTAITMAMTAVSGLTNQSSDADVAAAQAAIDAARAAVGATTSLPASEIVDFQAEISTAQSNLDTAEMQIAAYRTHQMQLANVTGAVDLATDGRREPDGTVVRCRRRHGRRADHGGQLYPGVRNVADADRDGRLPECDRERHGGPRDGQDRHQQPQDARGAIRHRHDHGGGGGDGGRRASRPCRPTPTSPQRRTRSRRPRRQLPPAPASRPIRSPR